VARKFYIHYEMDDLPHHTVCCPQSLNGPQTIGALLHFFLSEYNEEHGNANPLEMSKLQIQTAGGRAFAPKAPLASVGPSEDLFVALRVESTPVYSAEPAVMESASSRPRPTNDGSALKASQAAKKENSYYYAHFATPDVPVASPKKIGTGKSIEDMAVTLEKYMLDDCDKKVKVHIPFDKMEDLPEDGIVCHFRDQSFDLRLYASDGAVYALNVAVLHDPIDKEECKVLRKKSKIIVVLKKGEGSYTWDTLHKTWGLNEPRDSITPNGGTPNTLTA